MISQTLLLLLLSPALSFSPPFIPRSPSSLAAHKIGIIGGGTVGGGIINILSDKATLFKTMTGDDLTISRLAVRTLEKPRDFTTPDGCAVTGDWRDVITDAGIETVVEVMGGVTDAKDVVVEALRAGKNVVTANKALIAAHLPEIESVLEQVNEGRETPVDFRYEAAVCGGIPIIASMQGDFVGDTVRMVTGIINGCTNFMLTKMDRDGLSYEESLALASDMGYAEADPTLDVGGFDARSKLKILMRLAYGVDVDEDDISCRGIQDLTKEDFEYAAMLGGTVKLMGVAKDLGDGRVAAFVSPTYVAGDDTLASISGATNAVEVLSDNLQQSTYIGQGAGRYPTANSCVNDIVKTARGDRNALPFNCKSDVKFVNDFESKFYVRLRYKDKVGITKECGQFCEEYGIGIYSILQNPIRNRDDACFVIVTDPVELSKVKKFVAAIEGRDWCKGSAFYMPLLRDEDV